MQPETRYSTMPTGEQLAQKGSGSVGTARGRRGGPDAEPHSLETRTADCTTSGNAGESEPPQAPTPDALLGALSAHVKAQRLRVLELELALADAEARILSQAQLLCGTNADGEGGLFSRRPVREIVEEVLIAYPGIGWADVIGVRRERRLVEPRIVARSTGDRDRRRRDGVAWAADYRQLRLVGRRLSPVAGCSLCSPSPSGGCGGARPGARWTH